jgi:hypothetical protein
MEPVGRDDWPRVEIPDGNAAVHRGFSKASHDGLGCEAYDLASHDWVQAAFAQPGDEPFRSHRQRAHYSTGALCRMVMNSSASCTYTGSSPEKRFGFSP